MTYIIVCCFLVVFLLFAFAVFLLSLFCCYLFGILHLHFFAFFWYCGFCCLMPLLRKSVVVELWLWWVISTVRPLCLLLVALKRVCIRLVCSL